MDDKFKQQLREMALMQRRLGNDEFRIAAMRCLKQTGFRASAQVVGAMNVDDWLTPDELAERERMP